MKRYGPDEFETLRSECSSSTRDLLDFLRTVAAHAGPAVEAPTFEVRAGGLGLGVTYWSGGKRFCRFDPKPQADHVWAMIPGGDRAGLGRAGSVSFRADGPWLTLKDMQGAVQLVPHILCAYDDVSGRGR